MNNIDIFSNNSTSKIHIDNSIDLLKELLPNSKVIVIIDETVNCLYSKLFEEFPVIPIRSEEKEKTLQTVNYIYEKLIELEADRHSFLLGVGGGIVCDITGYVASTYMRGIQFGFIATTLMAQVDAAIGGKNGVNFHGYKNIIGTINLPNFVFCDVRFLTTLPTREFNAGFAEIIKYGLIQDLSILTDVEDNIEKYKNFDLNAIIQLIIKCARIKANIVNTDIQEKGIRKILNFGHTIGHALEKVSSKYNHGEAVSIGMMVALKISQLKGYISETEISRIVKLLQLYNLPTNIDNKSLTTLSEAITLDKKRNNNSIDYIILSKIGKAEVLSIDILELKSNILIFLK
ncbi:MAG: 3-dehydroquinate synthase [Bacteroidota bacterium]